MAIVPARLEEKISFFASRLAVFAEHAAQIGLTEAEAAQIAAKVEAARAAGLEQAQAQAAARAATSRYNAAVNELGEAGATAIMKIRTWAESTDNPSVYELAHIPPIAKRSPMAEPGKPSDCKTTLDGNGSLILEWACKNPKGSMGTVYAISRQLDDDGPFIPLATVGGKRFVDATIPAGTSRITYQIQAMRSTKIGPLARFPITLTGGSRLPSFQLSKTPAILAA